MGRGSSSGSSASRRAAGCGTWRRTGGSGASISTRTRRSEIGYIVAVDLHEALRTRTARVGVIGLGHTGLPLAVALAEAGFSVVGVDVDDERLARLAAGERVSPDVAPERAIALIEPGRLSVSSHRAAVDDADVLVLALPTPSAPTTSPIQRRCSTRSPACRRRPAPCCSTSRRATLERRARSRAASRRGAGASAVPCSSRARRSGSIPATACTASRTRRASSGA